jgi:hypothetical protein
LYLKLNKHSFTAIYDETLAKKLKAFAVLLLSRMKGLAKKLEAFIFKGLGAFGER